ncbi:hypothetical protein [Sulfurimonas sp.]|uniref:hypothetical protein n=1 Tax=Sulfurimonas sp. TaxID=2022749 RepID=UPI00260378D9|nr:hypothetical protein [Sulfurimonas sp.]MCW8895366.1 hypothetical protein [Sulfurimonas sp.]MCW9067509.1 hypothetical protein [Sulfurimonas sp.]
MTKILQALLTGMFFTFIFDFFIFLGIQQNYIDFYNIDLYYNILFADNQNLYIFFLFSVILGFIIIYLNNDKISIAIIGFLSILAMSTLIPSVGYTVGEMLFMTKNTTLKDSRYIYHGDIYYDGRKQITFYDYELKKTILLNKKDLK